MDDLLMQNPQKSSTSHRRQSLKLEECLINGEKIKLPQALCENTELFQALFSVDSWNAFTEQQRRHLMVINSLLQLCKTSSGISILYFQIFHSITNVRFCQMFGFSIL